jgi:uncharacterized membrane protein YgdD (TMEM256/DUF423 family)
MTRSQSALLAAGLLGAAGVVTGALGAHALAPALTARDSRGVWETAVQFHLLHAVALLGVAAWIRSGERSRGANPSEAGLPGGSLATDRRLRWAVRGWVAGIILFSGSLYALAFGLAPHWMGPLTPLGGICLIGGWLMAGAAALAAKHEG